MTTETEINQEDVPVTQNHVTNHNGHVFRIADFPEYSGHVGDEVLGEVENLIDEYVFASPQQISLFATWAAHANCYQWWSFTPRLGITAPDAGSGKSQALKAVWLLTNNSSWFSNISGAGLFTATEALGGSIFLDEATDAFKKGDKDLLGVIKTGVESMGVAARITSSTSGRTLHGYSTYGAIAFNGVAVDSFCDAQIHSRTQWVYMRKAFRNEQRKLLDDRIHRDRFAEVGSRLVAWLKQNEQKIRSFTEADLPPNIYNRDRNKWLPLFAIASVVGGRTLRNLEQIVQEETDSVAELSEVGTLLLATQDIYSNWDKYSPLEPRDSKISAFRLAELLAKWEDEDGQFPYSKFHASRDPDERSINKLDLFRILRPICRPERSRSKFDSNDRSSGYVWGKLLDAADRLLPDEFRDQRIVELEFCHADSRDKEVA